MFQRRLAHIMILLCAYIGALWGVPATNAPIVHTTDDGRCDTMYLYGDEHCSYRSATRIFQLPASYETAMSRAPQKQMLSSYVPSSGKVRIPVILVNFQDVQFTIEDPVARFEDLFNGNGGSNPSATGSVRDYFTASSDSVLTLEYSVFGPYTLSHEMAYYGANNTNNAGVATDHNIRARDLVLEAAQLAVDNGVDLSVFDNNDDGLIDNISIVVAGYNEAEGGAENTIWPHYSIIQNSGKYSDKYLYGYLMISEYRGSGGRIQAGIGTYCHEFGHALGLPDLYDTRNSSNYTVGEWDIMCSGSYNNNGCTPPSYTAFERFMMGWMIPTQIQSAGYLVLPPIESSNEAFLIASKPHNLSTTHPDPSEYFLLENRQAEGWDAGKGALVATGLLITHITFNGGKWNNNTFNAGSPLGFAIESAGMSHATKSSAADIFPGSTQRTSWVPTLNNGTSLTDWSVSNIRQLNTASMSFYVGDASDMALSFDTEEAEIVTTYLASPYSYDTAHLQLQINHLQQPSVRLHLSSNYFRYSVDSGANWLSHKDTAAVPVIADSAYSIPVWVIHTPSRKNCGHVYGFLTASTADESASAQVPLSGTSPRPILISTPVIDSVTNVSSSSFRISWEPQEDAEFYYYTLYTLAEGKSEEIEDLSAHFTASDQSVLTRRFLYPPEWLSIWLSNDYTPNSVDPTVGGEIRVSGSPDGKEWEQISVLTIQRTTRNIERDIELDTTRHYRQFKLDYTHLGGSGGAIVEDLTAHYDFVIHYKYQLEEIPISALSHSAMFRDLEPATTYYFAMESYEEKGCEPHYSDLSTPIAVQTDSISSDPRLIVTRDADGQYIVHLHEIADGKHTLGIYDNFGHLVEEKKPQYGTLQIPLPPLTKGQLYILKYYSGSITRKALYGKFIYY